MKVAAIAAEAFRLRTGRIHPSGFEGEITIQFSKNYGSETDPFSGRSERSRWSQAPE
jgi:hypothetical protein